MRILSSRLIWLLASAPSNLEILTGGTIDMGGLSASVDVMLNSSNVVDIASWDLGLDYAMGDMSVAFAYDSQNDWGMSASMGSRWLRRRRNHLQQGDRRS